jgi:hypothetical protein
MEYISFIFPAGLLTFPPETLTHFVFHFTTGVGFLSHHFSIFATKNILMFLKTNRCRVVRNLYSRLVSEVCKLER